MIVNDLVNLIARQTGVLGEGQTLSAQASNDILLTLNMMLAQWQVKRWLIYGTVDWYITSTGAESYGWDNSSQRIDKIEAAFFRQTIPSVPYKPDYQLEVIQAREDYNRIMLKTLETFPQYVYYDGLYPTGTFYFWPIPPADLYEMHISIKAVLGSFTDLTQTINLPPEYQEALLYNAAVRVRPLFQLPPDPTIIGLARASLETLRNANAQVGRLQMPTMLKKGNFYNVYSDQET